MNIDKLKQKILDLAIRGKLVPQDPNDEPASVLIDRIREEKKKLIKQGKIKADKEESYIYKGSDNCYYENYFGTLPNKWVLCKFGSIVNIYRGASPRPIKQHLTSDVDGIPWIMIGDTKPGEIYISKTAKKIKKESAKKSVFVKKGTLILSNSMSFGRPYILNINGCIHDGWLAIEIINNTIDINFLQYILQGYMWYFKIKATGTGVSNLNIDRVLNMPFALPPLKEQKRILKFLLKTDDIFNKINNNIVSINEISKQIRLKVLDNIFEKNSSYKSYYEKEYTLNDLLPYEQPAKYIVKNTDYNDKYKTPVITPGKSFILGHTNEVDGIYKVKNKVIIFDDFTTASRLVNFNFKVKSSALKILKSSDEDKFNIEYLFYLLQTIKVINNTHKRYWISEYAPKKLKIHIFDEQIKIVKKINKIFSVLNCCD